MGLKVRTNKYLERNNTFFTETEIETLFKSVYKVTKEVLSKNIIGLHYLVNFFNHNHNYIT